MKNEKIGVHAVGVWDLTPEWDVVGGGTTDHGYGDGISTETI